MSGMGRTTSSDGLAATRLSPVHAVKGMGASAAWTSWDMRPSVFDKRCLTGHFSGPLHVGAFVMQCTAAVGATCKDVSCCNADLHGSVLRPCMRCRSCMSAWCSTGGPCLALASAQGAVGVQEAGNLLLRPLRHVEPDPVTRHAQAPAGAQEGEVPQVVQS